jgi:hypothetical protein
MGETLAQAGHLAVSGGPPLSWTVMFPGFVESSPWTSCLWGAFTRITRLTCTFGPSQVGGRDGVGSSNSIGA